MPLRHSKCPPEPGSVVRFDVSVSDVEGDSVTVSVELPTLGGVLHETDATDSGLVTLFSLEYTCPLGSEVPYVVVVTARDDVEHIPSGDWDSVSTSLLVNTPPVAVLEGSIEAAGTGEDVNFDATASSDEETDSETLQARWDWESDGEWDTAWSDDLEPIHAYALPGLYVVTVEVRDSNELTSTATVGVTVTGVPIPEFPLVVFPVIAIMFAVAGRRRRTQA